jgi:hypothetical protein
MEPTNTEETKLIPQELTEDEEKALKIGMDVQAILTMPGWKTIQDGLEDRMIHSWVDPRETKSKEDWEWRELNAFHSHDVARQIIEDINEIVRSANELQDIKLGKKKRASIKI